MRPEKLHWRHSFKKQEPLQASVEKVKYYEVIFKGKPDKHKITISLKDDWHTGKIIFSKSLLYNTDGHSKGTSFMAKDLNSVKHFIRNFLNRFGEYTITPSD